MKKEDMNGWEIRKNEKNDISLHKNNKKISTLLYGYGESKKHNLAFISYQIANVVNALLPIKDVLKNKKNGTMGYSIGYYQNKWVLSQSKTDITRKHFDSKEITEYFVGILNNSKEMYHWIEMIKGR